MTTIKDMTWDCLKEFGFDALFNDRHECGCKLNDLMPCDEPSPKCVAAYWMDCKHCGQGFATTDKALAVCPNCEKDQI